MFDEHDYQAALATMEDPADAAAFLDHDEVENFINTHRADKGYECSIFGFVKSPTSGTIQRAHQITYENKIPGAEAIVCQFGPGEYEWQLVGKKRGPDSPKSITVQRILIGPHWARMHKQFQRKQEMLDRKERIEQMREEAEDMRLLGPYGAAPANGGLDVTKLVELILATRQQPTTPTTDPMAMLVLAKALDSKPGFDFTKLATGLGAMAPFTTPLLTRVFGGQQPQRTSNDILVEKLMEAVVGNKIEALSPPEPENPWYVDILAGLANNLPVMIQTLKALPASARQEVAAAAIESYQGGRELYEAFKKDPAALAYAVKEWDKRYHPADVDVLLASIGAKRPAAAAAQQPAAAASDQAPGAGPGTPGYSGVPDPE